MKRIVYLFSLIFICFLTINVNALSYDVEQVTNVSSIKNDSKGYYFIVADNPENGKQYAFSVKSYDVVTEQKPDGTTKKTNVLNLDNDFNEVTINGNTLNINTNNIKESLFYFVKNKNTMSLGSDKYALGTANALIDDPAKIQLDFNDCEIAISTNGKNLILEKAANSNEFYFYRYYKDNETTYNRARFLSFNSSTNNFTSRVFYDLPTSQTICGYVSNNYQYCYYTFKLYRIKNFYNIKDVDSYKLKTDSNLIAKKSITKENNYASNHLKNVRVSLNSNDVYRDSDIVVLLDNSLSLKEKYNDSIMNFVKELLNSNKNNRVSVVKFANNIIDKDRTLALGLTSDFNSLNAIISNDSEYESGTNYSLAFETAYEFLAKDPMPNRDQIVILLSDGAPTFYNKIKFSWLGDADSATHADNWSDYITNTSLEVVDGMKNAGILFYSMGIEVQDKAIKADGTHILNKSDSEEVLKNIATSTSNYFEISSDKDKKKGFDSLLNRMLNTSRYYVKDVVVNDSIPKGYELISKTMDGKKPVVELYMDNNGEKTILETITFIDNNTVQSSVLGDKNILSNNIIQGKYFRYDTNSQEMKVNLDEVHGQVILNYYIYSEADNPPYTNTMTVDYKGFNNKDLSTSVTISEKDELSVNPKTWNNIAVVLSAFMLIVIGSCFVLIKKKKS